jgi:pantetheine-phosphate adenylyltransferase
MTMSSDRVAIYPGSFDPLTNGHVDVIQRGIKLFDRVIVAILVHAEKKPLFAVADRLAMIREVFHGQAGVEVDTFDGLLVEYVRKRRASAIVKGLRGAADFEYEKQMAQMNRHLNGDVETVFIMSAPEWSHVSSSLIKEVAALGGAIAGLVPPPVAARLDRLRGAGRTLNA